MGRSPVANGMPSWCWSPALWNRSHTGRSCVSGDRGRRRLWVLLRVPGWGSRAVVSLRRRVECLLVMVVGPGCCWDRQTCGANERVAGRNAEYPLAHIRRVTQNRTGGHLGG